MRTRAPYVQDSYGKYEKRAGTTLVTAEYIKEGDIITSPSGYQTKVLRRLNPAAGAVIELELEDMAGNIRVKSYQGQAKLFIIK